MAFSPDSLSLAVGDKRGRIGVFDVKTGKKVHEMQSPEKGVASLAFSPNGSLLVAGGWATGLITLWDTKTGKLVEELRGHGAWVSSVMFGRDDQTLVSASADQTIRIWAMDVDARETHTVLQGSLDEIWDLAWLAEGQQFVSAAKDGTVSLWEASHTSDDDQPTIIPGLAYPVGLAKAGSQLIAVNQEQSQCNPRLDTIGPYGQRSFEILLAIGQHAFSVLNDSQVCSGRKGVRFGVDSSLQPWNGEGVAACLVVQHAKLVVSLVIGAVVCQEVQ